MVNYTINIKHFMCAAEFNSESFVTSSDVMNHPYDTLQSPFNRSQYTDVT